MTKAQLIEKAKQLGLDLTTKMTKADILDEIALAEAKTEECQPDDRGEILVTDLEDYQLTTSELKLNPMEKVMAVELLTQGFEFYCQYQIDCPKGWVIGGRKYFVADFYLPKLNLIIETDGKIHLKEENQVKDRYKDLTLASMGYRIFRFNWDDVMGKSGSVLISDFLDMLVRFLLANER
jgi:very-short-patch-repair endonuclease